MSEAQNTGSPAASDARPVRLRDALRRARIEAADRTGVVVDLRDAEVARLEILKEALDPLFAQIPDQGDLFDRGLSQGESHDVADIVDAVTGYVARRMIEREHALVATPMVAPAAIKKPRRSRFWSFALGFVLGALALFALALFASLRDL